MNAWRMRRPSCVRIGMFCKFGSVRGQPSGGRHRLVIGGMNAAGGRIDLQRQIVGIGGFELRHAAIFQNQFRQRIALGEFLEHILRGRGLSGRRLAHHRNAEFAEEDFLQLLRRIHVEHAAGFLVRLRLQFQHARRQLRALRLQQCAIHEHAGALHAEQHGHQRLLDVFVDELQAAGPLRFAAISPDAAAA